MAIKFGRFQRNFSDFSVALQYNYDSDTDTFPLVQMHCSADWGIPVSPKLVKKGDRLIIEGFYKHKKIAQGLIDEMVANKHNPIVEQ